MTVGADVADLLETAEWQCASAPPGAVRSPKDLPDVSRWWPATVPGTAAGALRAAGEPHFDLVDYDADDWFFRTTFASGAGPRELVAAGLATVADLWVDGQMLAHSENMFKEVHRCVDLEAGTHELVIRFAALRALCRERRPRPRWKTYLVNEQNLRFFRTTMLGRIPGWAAVPAPVGPWRGIRLQVPDPLEPRGVRLVARCAGSDGLLGVAFRLPAPPYGSAEPPDVLVEVAGAQAAMTVRRVADGFEVSGQLQVTGVERWWPHTHGRQRLYEVTVRSRTDHCGAGVERAQVIGAVGFRSITVDRSHGGFQVIVNDVPVFCRGACWFPPDPVCPGGRPDLVIRSVELAREANCNMLRVPGSGVYPGDELFRRCDELGILVWQDAMFAFSDPPADEAFQLEVEAEVTEVFSAAGAHPSLAVICGNQEVEEVASMFGLPEERRRTPLFEERIPRILADLLPGTPYVSSTPSGGVLPFEMESGTSQYFGIGGYMRPLTDVRRSNVRFATECLAFATPPEPSFVDAHHGGPVAAGHDPEWKRSLHHDAGRSWDMEDVRDFYVRTLFDVDPLRLRYEDPARALDLGRATNAALMEEVLSEWRRPASSCAGGLVLGLSDLRRGPGWGVVDADGVPKAPYYALRRVFAPRTLVLTDEGLNGLACHVLNDTDTELVGHLSVALVAGGELVTEEAEVPIRVPARSGLTRNTRTVLDGFRDVTYAYRFGPPSHDAVVVAVRDAERGETVAERVYFPMGQARRREPDVGLAASAVVHDGGGLTLTVSTRRLAQWVAVDAPGFVPEDSWFHMPPGSSRRFRLMPIGPPGRLRGRVRALNSERDCRIEEATCDG